MPSALRDSRLGGGWSSIFKVARGEEARSPNRAPGVRFRWTAEIFSAKLWAQAGMPSAPRVSRIQIPILRDFSRRDPEASCHLYSTRRLCYGPHCLQLSGYRFSQSRDPCAQILEPFLARPRYAIPRADPRVLLDPDPTVIHLLASRVLAT
jgi:hypothetical protein